MSLIDPSASLAVLKSRAKFGFDKKCTCDVCKEVKKMAKELILRRKQDAAVTQKKRKPKR